MKALRPTATAAALIVVGGALFSWTVQEARHQRRALEEALTREASLLADSLGPGLEAASNASRELDELVLWKLLDNARLIAVLQDKAPIPEPELERLLESNGLDSILFVDPSGEVQQLVGESFDLALVDELAPLLTDLADELILGSTSQHQVEHLAAAARLPAGGAVLVRVEWSTAHTFARRLGVESLLMDLLGTGVVLYLSYVEEPSSLVVEGAWNGGPVPPPNESGGLRTVYDRPIFEVNVPLESPAGITAFLRVGLDGTALETAARDAMARTLVMGTVLAALALAGTAFAFVSQMRSRDREQAARRLSELETARRRSERLAAAGALTAGLAHEVRSPLNAIGLAAQRLERKLAGDDERQSLAASIGDEVQRLEKVLRGFLQLASPATGAREMADLSDIAGEVCDLLETEAESEGVLLHPVSGTGVAEVDREAMRRALINLVRNAIQASSRGGEIRVAVDGSGEEVEIVVEDQGSGLDADLLERIFDPFVSSRSDGTGLGLALVRRVVEEHNGSVQLTNRSRGGARAVLRIPAKGADL